MSLLGDQKAVGVTYSCGIFQGSIRPGDGIINSYNDHIKKYSISILSHLLARQAITGLVRVIPKVKPNKLMLRTIIGGSRET